MLPEVSVPIAASSQSYDAMAAALPDEDEDGYCQPSPLGLKGARTSILFSSYQSDSTLAPFTPRKLTSQQTDFHR